MTSWEKKWLDIYIEGPAELFMLEPGRWCVIQGRNKGPVGCTPVRAIEKCYEMLLTDCANKYLLPTGEK